MKRTKRILALLLALTLIFTLATPAFAADGIVTVDGKVQVEINGKKIDIPTQITGGSHEEDLQDHTFDIYEIFDAEYAKDDKGAATNELVNIKWGAGVDPQNLFTALKDEYVTTYNRLAADNGKPQITDNPFADIGEFIANSDTLIVNQSAYKVAQVLAGFGEEDSLYARAFAILAAKKLSEKKVNANVVEYGDTLDLDAGYYLIVDVSTLNEVDSAKNLSVVMMPTKGEFKPKSKVDVPELEKKVLEVNDSVNNTENPVGKEYEWGDAADFDMNDVVPFVLTGTLPTNYADYETYFYQISDKLSEGLQLENDSIKVLVNGEDVTENQNVVIDKIATTEATFTVTFSNLKNLILTPKAEGKDIIQVVYTAKLTGDGVVYGGEGNPNEAWLKFSNNPNGGGEGTTPKDIVTVFTFKLNFDKVDDEGEPLSGAGFTLYKWDANKLPEEAEEGTKAGMYVQVGDELVMDTEDADGNFVFNFEGLDAGKYKLVESTVPTGYNKAQDMIFTITANLAEDKKSVESLTVSDVEDETGKKIMSEDGTALTITGVADTGILSTTVVNLKGVVLPSTGGIGTTIFYVVGGLLILGAALVLITKKRLKNAEAE